MPPPPLLGLSGPEPTTLAEAVRPNGIFARAAAASAIEDGEKLFDIAVWLSGGGPRRTGAGALEGLAGVIAGARGGATGAAVEDTGESISAGRDHTVSPVDLLWK
jgi:hypothetical protein